MRRLVPAVLFLFAGCATTPSGLPAMAPSAGVMTNLTRTQAHIDQALSELADLEIADLQWASADAHAKGDVEFYTCWDGVIPIVQGLKAAKAAGGGTLPASIPRGPAGSVQAIRDVVHVVVGGGSASSGPSSIMVQLNVACSPMAQAIIADQVRIAAQVGSIMSGAGAAPAMFNALKGIQPILKLLPIPINLGG